MLYSIFIRILVLSNNQKKSKVMKNQNSEYSKELFDTTTFDKETLQAFEQSLGNVGVTLPKNELVTAINSLGGKYSFFYMEYETPQRGYMKKKGNPFLETIKVSKLSAATLPDYYQRAEKITGAEISENEKKPAWYQPILESCPILVTDKKTQSKTYLKFEKLHSALNTTYLCNGAKVDYKELEQYYYGKPDSKYGVEIRVINLNNVTRLHINGFKINLKK